MHSPLRRVASPGGFVLLALVLGACGGSSNPLSPSRPGSPASNHLLLLTWNTNSGKDANGAGALEAQAAVIAASGAQVVALQEVEEASSSNPPSAYTSALQRLTGAAWTSVWIPAPMPPNRPPLGNAILTRLPIVRSLVIQIDSDPSDPTWIDTKRSAGSITVAVNSVAVSVITTHLATDDNQRARQVQTLIGWVGAISAPRFLGGDFNTLESDPGYFTVASVFRDVWTMLMPGDPGITKLTETPRRIDYWWWDPSDPRAKPASIRVLQTGASDHYALLLDATVGVAPASAR